MGLLLFLSFVFKLAAIKASDEYFVDLGHDLSSYSMKWPSSAPFIKTALSVGYQEGGFWYVIYIT